MVGFPHPEDVVETCTTYLVTVSPSNGTIKLAHFSVKEFLVVSESIHWYQLTKNGGHMDIANRALNDMLDKTEVLTEEAVHDLPLLKYAAAHWSGHFSELTDSDAKFRDLENKIYRLFSERIVYLNWRRVARDNFRLSSWNNIWGDVLEPPIYLACKMGMQSIVERLLSQGANPCTQFQGKSTVTVAAQNGHLTIVQQLLGNIEISAEIASEIASSIDLDNVPHEEVEDLLDLLLSTKVLYDKTANGCVLLNEDFVSAIAGNKRSGRRLMCLLLDRQDKLEVPVTESVVETVVRNRVCGEEMMRILIDRRRKDIQITEGLMESVAADSRYTPDISELILQHWGATVPLNQKIVKEFVRRAPAKVMELLLQIRGHEIQITEELVVAAAANGDHAVFRLLWERVSGIEITSKTWQRIDWSSNGLEWMEMVLAKCPRCYFLENEIILKVARSVYGLPLMRMLLDKREAGLVVFDVSEATMIAAASNKNCPQQMMELVINNADSEISVNEKIFSSAIGNVWAGDSALEYLLELEQNLPITEEVLVSAAAAPSLEDYRVLEFLFNKFPDFLVTDRVFRAAKWGSKVLLKRGRHVQDCQLIGRLIGRLLGQGIVSLQELTILFDEGLVEIDDNLVDAVGTQNALIMALQGCDAMEKLLDLRRNDVTVTEEVVLRALDEGCVDGQAFKIMMDRLGSAVPVTEKILEKAFLEDRSRPLDFLLKERRDWNLQQVWDAIWQNDRYDLWTIMRSSNALLKYGEFDVSQTLLEFLPLKEENGSFGGEEIDDLVNLCVGRDISAPAMEMISVMSFEWGDAKTIGVFIDRLVSAVPMTEKVWYALWLNDGFTFLQKVIISNILLEYGEFDISQILLEFLPLEEEKGGFDNEEIDELVNLCVGQDISAPATEMLVEILFGRGDANSIMKFVKRKPTTQLTDGLIQLAERNKYAYKKFLMPFLYSKRAADQNIKVAAAKTEAEED